MTYPTKTEMLFALQRWGRLRNATEARCGEIDAVLGGVKTGKEINHPFHEHAWMVFEAYTEALAASFGDRIQTPDGWAGECLLEQMVADGKTLDPVTYVNAVIAARGNSLISPRGSEGEEVAV